MSRFQFFVKRVFDIILALLGLFVFSPIIIAAWLVSLMETRSGGFFIQERVGRDGKIFNAVKITTMNKVKGIDTTITSLNDIRITKSGTFFRKTKIDELPQLFNVLKGDMSFVGPRPERPEFVDGYNERIAHYALRHKVKPGLTGWAQICYPYGESEAETKQK